MSEQFIGEVTHYFGAPGVAALTLTGPLSKGDTIHVKGATSDFTQAVVSLQIEHESVDSAIVGDQIGIEVVARTRVHDRVFVVTTD